MAVTRSGRSIGDVGKKIKFSDDGEVPSDIEVLSVSTKESTQEPEQVKDSESDLEDDSDEAPEEESVSQSKFAVLQKMKQQEKLEQETRKHEREKRKQRDLHFKQQQDAKREKLKELAGAEKLPDFLPEEALESDHEDETLTKNSSSGKHLRSEDFEKEDAAMRKKTKLEKLRNLKEMRQQALKKGPVYVQVQHNITPKSRVPRAEQSVLDTKSQWLQRESLNRK
ncbi:hypothetical protein OXX79_007226 [Metschnikowia pulcherrima]